MKQFKYYLGFKFLFLVGILLHSSISVWFPGCVVSYFHGEGVE